MREQRTLFDLTQDGLVIGKKIQRIYPEFDVSTFVSDVRTEMEGQTLYNVTKAIGRVLRQHLPQDYSDALAILIKYVGIEAPPEPTRHPTAEDDFQQNSCRNRIYHWETGPKMTINGIFFDLYGTLLVYGNMDSV